MRRVLVYGGLSALGAEVCELALGRGDVVAVCDASVDDDDKRVALDRLRSLGGSRFVEVEESKVEGFRATEVVVLGLCARVDGASRLDALLKSCGDARAAVVASSAAVYEASIGGAVRGGPSVRTHKRPLLAESDAVQVDGTDSAGLAWRLERAAKARARDLKICVLRYFGVFGGGADWGRDVVARFLVNDDGCTTLPSAGAYADVCGVAEAAEAAVRALDALVAGGPKFTVVNVGTGRAQRAEHVCRAVAKALASVGVRVSEDDVLARKNLRKGHTARAGFGAADISKLKTLIGWAPSSPLDVALSRELAKATRDPSSPRNLRRAFPPQSEEAPRPVVEEPTAARSLAALDLSSCVATTLLQVSRSPNTNNTRSHKQQRFFELNRRTVMPIQQTTTHRRSLATVFAVAA